MSKENIFDPLECGYYENCREEGVQQGYECAIEKFIDKFIKRTQLRQMTKAECIKVMHDIADEMKEQKNG